MTKPYAFARQIDAPSPLSSRRPLNSFDFDPASLRHHGSLYFRDPYRWYDFDPASVEAVIHIRRAISESVNHSALSQRNTSSPLQGNHGRRWIQWHGYLVQSTMYPLLGNVIRLDGGTAKRASSTITAMPARHTTRKGNSRSYRVGSLGSRKTNSHCCRYRLFRCNTRLRYTGVQSVLRGRGLSATTSATSTPIS